MYHVLKLYALLLVYTHLAAGLHSSLEGFPQNTLKARVFGTGAGGELHGRRSILLEPRSMLSAGSDTPIPSRSQQRLVARGPVHLQLKAKKDAAIKNVYGATGTNFDHVQDRTWKQTTPNERAHIDRTHAQHAAGMMSTTGDSGKSSGKIKGPEVRADMIVNPGAKSTVTIKDPSRQHYPSGQHREVVTHDRDPRKDIKSFRASSNDPHNPASIKVKTSGKGSTTLEAAPQHEAHALDHGGHGPDGLPYVPKFINY